MKKKVLREKLALMKDGSAGEIKIKGVKTKELKNYKKKEKNEEKKSDE